MDIRLLIHGLPRLSPNLLAEVQESVREGGGDRSERQPIGNSEGGGQVKRAVSTVRLLVEA